jgi:hypothetical protein
MDGKAKFDKLIEESGVKEVRHGKHPILLLPDGTTMPFPNTPSDVRSWQNTYVKLRARLGLRPEHSEGERRPRKVKRERVQYGVITGRFQTDVPNFTEVPKSFGEKLAEAMSV